MLPCVNTALRSSKQVSYEVGELRIEIVGSKSGVHIYNAWGIHGWIRPLLKALRAGPYKGYTVSLWGDHTHSRGPTKELDEHNIIESLRKFQRNHSDGYDLSGSLPSPRWGAQVSILGSPTVKMRLLYHSVVQGGSCQASSFYGIDIESVLLHQKGNDREATHEG